MSCDTDLVTHWRDRNLFQGEQFLHTGFDDTVSLVTVCDI